MSTPLAGVFTDYVGVGWPTEEPQSLFVDLISGGTSGRWCSFFQLSSPWMDNYTTLHGTWNGQASGTMTVTSDWARAPMPDPYGYGDLTPTAANSNTVGQPERSGPWYDANGDLILYDQDPTAGYALHKDGSGHVFVLKVSLAKWSGYTYTVTLSNSGTPSSDTFTITTGDATTPEYYTFTTAAGSGDTSTQDPAGDIVTDINANSPHATASRTSSSVYTITTRQNGWPTLYSTSASAGASHTTTTSPTVVTSAAAIGWSSSDNLVEKV